MGQLKEIIALADQTGKMTAEIKEALNLLYELSKQKADFFEEKIAKELRTAGTDENPTVPIAKMLRSHQEIRVVTENTSNEDIKNGINTALKSVLTGSKDGIIDGLTSLIDDGLKVILGAGEGEEMEQHAYYITTDGLAIVRLDFIYWCRHITAKSITKYAKKSIVCTAVKSSVDLTRLDFNSFLFIYQEQLNRCNFSNEELMNEIMNARKIYDQLTNNTNITDVKFLRSEISRPTLSAKAHRSKIYRPTSSVKGVRGQKCRSTSSVKALRSKISRQAPPAKASRNVRYLHTPSPLIIENIGVLTTITNKVEGVWPAEI